MKEEAGRRFVINPLMHWYSLHKNRGMHCFKTGVASV